MARLPYTYWRVLRNLYIRAHYVPPKGDDGDVESVDMDKTLGISDGS